MCPSFFHIFHLYLSLKARGRKRDVFKQALRNLASLSLVDYKWRSALFKKNEADRMEEEWMARMMGKDPAYARPMDANDEVRGPLVRNVYYELVCICCTFHYAMTRLLHKIIRLRGCNNNATLHRYHPHGDVPFHALYSKHAFCHKREMPKNPPSNGSCPSSRRKENALDASPNRTAS